LVLDCQRPIESPDLGQPG